MLFKSACINKLVFLKFIQLLLKLTTLGFNVLKTIQHSLVNLFCEFLACYEANFGS